MHQGTTTVSTVTGRSGDADAPIHATSGRTVVSAAAAKTSLGRPRPAAMRAAARTRCRAASATASPLATGASRAFSGPASKGAAAANQLDTMAKREWIRAWPGAAPCSASHRMAP
jgi:hypothetical protein